MFNVARRLQSLRTNFLRDDLTVEVIFFGEGDKSGNVTRNEEASASLANSELKAKL